MINFEKKVYPLDDEGYLIDNDLMVKLSLKGNGVYMPLAEISEGSNKNAIEELDFYVVDNWHEIVDYTFKTDFKVYNIPLSVEDDFDNWDIEYYGVKITEIDGYYHLTWGYEFDRLDQFIEFKQGGDYDIFDSLNCQMNIYIIEKMKEAFKKLVNFDEIKVKW